MSYPLPPSFVAAAVGSVNLVWISKYYRKALYEQLRRYVGEVLRELAVRKESRILEGHLRPDHMHLLVSLPPKCAVSQVAGFLKGMSAIHIAWTYAGPRKNFTRQHFGTRGHDVSTVGADEDAIRQHIQRREDCDAVSLVRAGRP